MSNKEDTLGDRMKLYEGMEAERRLLPRLPVMIRIDGRSFSGFTSGMERPFDPKMSRLMIDVTRLLVEEFGALIGYTQSDEISLVLNDDEGSERIPFDGRIHKLASSVATKATAAFNRALPTVFPDRVARLPTFDARVWNVPTKAEAANTILWRERDATKNSISMAAHAHYSHTALHKKNAADMHELLHAKGINWNDYPALFKRGTFIQRRKTSKPFTFAEIETLPPKHAARTNPNLLVERSTLIEVDMPPFDRVKNRVEVIFEGAEPILATDDVEPEPAPNVLKLQTQIDTLKGLLRTSVGVYRGHVSSVDEAWLDESIDLLGLNKSEEP